MHAIFIRALTLGMVLLAGLAGCGDRQVSSLPTHQLDFSRPARTVHPRAVGAVSTAAVPGTTQQPTWPKNPSVTWHVRGERQWRYIVVHHSATVGGNADEFDKLHRAPPRNWDELGYHFVIDNGNGGPDGRIEVGPRWWKQKWGAHTGGTPDNEYNEVGIGICLVGDFSNRMPSPAQMAALRRLVVDLVATYDIPAENIIGHRDAPDAATECPGGQFHRYLMGTFVAEVERDARSARVSAR